MTTTRNRPMRRYDRQLSDEVVFSIVDSAPFATVCTCDDEMCSYGVPVNAVRVDNRLYFHTTASDSRRNDNIFAHPDICLTFVSHAEVDGLHFSCNYACAVVEGRCSLVSDPEEKLTALDALLGRWAPENPKEKNERYVAKHLDGCSVWRVDVLRFSGKSRAVPNRG